MSQFSDATIIVNSILIQNPYLFDGKPNPSSIVPYWFRVKNPAQPFLEESPKYVGPERREILERIKNWISYPCFDLPDSDFFSPDENKALEEYEKSYREWRNKKDEWNIAQNLIQLRKWIYWLTRFTNMNILDPAVMEFANLPTDTP